MVYGREFSHSLNADPRTAPPAARASSRASSRKEISLKTTWSITPENSPENLQPFHLVRKQFRVLPTLWISNLASPNHRRCWQRRRLRAPLGNKALATKTATSGIRIPCCDTVLRLNRRTRLVLLFQRLFDFFLRHHATACGDRCC